MQNDTTTPRRADEFDLPQLCRMIWSGKWLVASCTVAALVLAAVYVFFVAQPRYAINIHVDAPPASALAGLNQGREPAGLDPYTPQQVFNTFVRSLTSNEAAQQFVLRAMAYPENTEISASWLQQNSWRLSLAAPDPRGRNLHGITVSAETSALAQRHLVLFLGIVQAQALAALLDDATNAVSTRIGNIQNSMATERAIALRQRQDDILRLREALSVAEAIAQETPQLNLARPSSPEGLSSYLEGKELYARGARALRAELEVLEARKSDDAFIEGLREQEARLNLLKAISPDTQSLLPYRIDGEVIQPEQPVHPRKALIMALALVAGAMLGMLCALIRAMARTRPLAGFTDTA